MNDAMKIRAGDVVLVTVEKDRFTNCEEAHRIKHVSGNGFALTESCRTYPVSICTLARRPVQLGDELRNSTATMRVMRLERHPDGLTFAMGNLREGVTDKGACLLDVGLVAADSSWTHANGTPIDPPTRKAKAFSFDGTTTAIQAHAGGCGSAVAFVPVTPGSTYSVWIGKADTDRKAPAGAVMVDVSEGCDVPGQPLAAFARADSSVRCTECSREVDSAAPFRQMGVPGYQCSVECNYTLGAKLKLIALDRRERHALESLMGVMRALFETDAEVIAYVASRADGVVWERETRWNTADGRSETVRKNSATSCSLRFGDHTAKHMQTAWARGSDGKMPEATWFHRAKARAVAMTKVKT